MKTVLFICIGNCCRSQIAEGFARHLGAGIINAASAGLNPTATVSEDTVATMKEVGIDISDQFPKEFDSKRAKLYDIVVNMSGFDLPPIEKAVVAEWIVRDPYYEDASIFREVRDEIEKRVRDLIEDIQRNGTVTENLVVGQRIASDKWKKPALWQRFTNWR